MNSKASFQAIEVIAPKAMYDVLLKDPGAQLLDVRTKDEFAVSHLKRCTKHLCNRYRF